MDVSLLQLFDLDGNLHVDVVIMDQFEELLVSKRYYDAGIFRNGVFHKYIPAIGLSTIIAFAKDLPLVYI